MIRLILFAFFSAHSFMCFSNEAILKDEKIGQRVDELLREVVSKQEFAGTVLVFQKDEILFAKGYGLANPEHNIANDVHTVFRIGSMTKQFTAMAIMMLVEDGKVSLDDSVVKYLPGFEAAKDVKIRNLLTHSSGIKNYTNLEFYQEIKRRHNREIDIIERLYDLPLDFNPEEHAVYSNSNYLVLAYIIGKASGTSYENFLEKRIFRKLGLNSTGLDNHRKVVPYRASGLVPSGNGFMLADFVDMSVPRGAGDVYSSVLDLSKWYKALRDYELISKSSTETMLTPFKNVFAFGWLISQDKSRRKISHGGGIDGFRSHIAFYPESDSLIVVLSNVEGYWTWEVSTRLENILFEEEVKPFELYDEVPLDVEQAKDLVGTYELAPGVDLVITLKGDKLYGRITGQEAFRLFQTKENLFFLRMVNAQISFVRKRGKVNHLILHQGGRDTKGMKK